MTSEKLHHEMHLDNTSILLINIDKYVNKAEPDLSDLANDIYIY